jgi:hypothetical protein
MRTFKHKDQNPKEHYVYASDIANVEDAEFSTLKSLKYATLLTKFPVLQINTAHQKLDLISCCFPGVLQNA